MRQPASRPLEMCIPPPRSSTLSEIEGNILNGYGATNGGTRNPRARLVHVFRSLDGVRRDRNDALARALVLAKARGIGEIEFYAQTAIFFVYQEVL